MSVNDECFYFSLNDTTGKILNLTYPARKYFYDDFLHYNEAVHDWYNFGGLNGYQVLCLLAAWTLICISFIVNRKGKVIYFIVIAPTVILCILMIYGATLEGAGRGLELYVYPKWDHFGRAEVGII